MYYSDFLSFINKFTIKTTFAQNCQISSLHACAGWKHGPNITSLARTTINLVCATDLLHPVMDFVHTLRLHYNAVVGVHGKNCIIKDRVIYSRPLFKIFNATSFTFTGFHICKQMPHPPSLGMGRQSVYLVIRL